METVALEWTVLTWNVQGTKHTDVRRVADVISSESPDVVVLQEARRPQADDLASSLSMTSTWTEKHNPLHPFLSSRAEGAAILTPHELRSPGHTVVSVNTSMRSYKRRIVQWATIRRADTSAYRIYNVHLSPHDMSQERTAEAEIIARIVGDHGDAPPPVVAGDLNDQHDPALIGLLPGIEHVPSPPTNPAGHPSKALDHVLLPPQALRVSLSAPTGGPDWAELSDHLPVTVRFTFDWVQGGFAS